MIIKIGKKWLIKKSEGINVFDLHILKEGTKGARLGKIIDTPFAFGVSLGRCAQIILQEDIDSDIDVVDLKSFVNIYKTKSQLLVEEIKKALEESTK